MKHLLLITLSYLISMSVVAQNNGCYTYDQAGNRTTKSAFCAVSLEPNEVVSLSEFSEETNLEFRLADKVSDLTDLIVFPNPSVGLFHISDQDKWKGAVLNVYDSHGHLIENKKIDGEAIDISHLPSGSYYGVLSMGNNIKTTKFLITK